MGSAAGKRLERINRNKRGRRPKAAARRLRLRLARATAAANAATDGLLVPCTLNLEPDREAVVEYFHLSGEDKLKQKTGVYS